MGNYWHLESGTRLRIVVVACTAIQSGTAGGGAMRSLFSGWPKDKLAQIVTPFLESGTPDFGVCNDYRLIPPVGRVQKLDSSDSLLREGSYGRLPAWGKRVKPWFRYGKALVTPVREWLCSRSGYIRKLENSLRALRPEIVYALVGNYFLARAVTLVCKQVRVPLYLHIVDDYVTSLYDRVLFQSRLEALSTRWVKEAIEYATGHAAIGPHMAQEYQRRYGHIWTWFTTLCQASDYDPLPYSRHQEEPVRFVFAGNIGIGRWRLLQKLGNALGELAEEGISARLTIYTAPSVIEVHGKELTQSQVVDLKPWVPVSELPGIFHEADLLVHVESFDANYVKYTKWSLSSKISQYMMAGRPILAFGEPSLASIRLVAEQEAGFVLGSLTPDLIKSVLRSVIMNHEKRVELGRNGRQFAMKVFDGESRREHFQLELIKAYRHWHERQTRD